MVTHAVGTRDLHSSGRWLPLSNALFGIIFQYLRSAFLPLARLLTLNTIMLFFNAFFLPLVTLEAVATSSKDYSRSHHGKDCLSYAEALDISTRWLSVFSSGRVTSKKQLATIVSQNIASYDDTFEAPTFGIGQLWAAISSNSKTPTTNVTQTPLFLMHTCDQIGLNWIYNAVTTGYDS